VTSLDAASIMRQQVVEYVQVVAKLLRQGGDTMDDLAAMLEHGNGTCVDTAGRVVGILPELVSGLVLSTMVRRAEEADAATRSARAALAAEPSVAAEPPHDCSSCGTSIDRCDDLVAAGRACCVACAHRETHGDVPFGYVLRRRAREAKVGD